MSTVAMAKGAIRTLLRLFPSSRRLSGATGLEKSVTTATKVAASEFKPLYRRLSALGSMPRGSVEDTMAEWMREGRRVTETELINFVRQFRRHKSYKVALELMEWMNGSGGIKLSSSSHAVHLDLITKFKGIDEAEKYFENLKIFNQNHQTYGALLSGYCQEMMADKAIELYDKMQKLNFSHNTLTYNNLMMLYLKLGNAEKVPSLLQEMKAENISPDTFTYCLLMKSYATLNDIDSVERVMKEIEEDAKGSVSWFLYSNLASIFLEAGLVEKTKSALEKLEAVMDHHNRECYHYLISMHTGVGNLTEVIRVWKLLKSSFTKTTNRSYLIMFQSCIKLDEMDTLKQCYDEWQSIHMSFDIRLPYLVMSAYLKKDMSKEAELVLEHVTGSGDDSFTWEKFIRYHLKKSDVDLALRSLKFATCDSRSQHWIPNKELVKEFFSCFESEDVEQAESFYKMLKDINCLDVEAYEFLLQAYISAGKQEPTLRQRIESDGLDLTSKTKELLDRVCPLIS